MAQKDFGEVGLAEKSKPTAGEEIDKIEFTFLTGGLYNEYGFEFLEVQGRYRT